MAISDWRVPSKLVRIAPLQKTRGYHTRNFTISQKLCHLPQIITVMLDTFNASEGG
jgi:hypothetical protein